MSIVLDQQVRNGTFDTASVAVAPGSTQLAVSGTISAADAQNAANSCRITTRASFDGGQTFQPFGTPYTWQGGVGPKGNSPPPSEQGLDLPRDGSGNLPGFVMATLDTLGNSLNTGVDITVS